MTSITATSSQSPTCFGIEILSSKTAIPTTRSEAVWPSPQNVPIRDERATLLCSLTIVDTATMWSGSSACRSPYTNPRLSTATVLASIDGHHITRAYDPTATPELPCIGNGRKQRRTQSPEDSTRTVLALPSGSSSVTGGCPTFVRNNRTMVHNSQIGDPYQTNEAIARHPTASDVPTDTHLCIRLPVTAYSTWPPSS